MPDKQDGTSAEQAAESVDVDKLSDDDLGDLIDRVARGESPAQAGEVVEEDDSEDETEETESAEQAAEPDAAEDEQQQQAEGETRDEDDSEAAEEDTDDPTPGDLPETVRLRLEEMEARSKHFESLLGNQAGRTEYLQRENERLRRMVAESPQGRRADPGEDEDEIVGAEPRRRRAGVDVDRLIDEKLGPIRKAEVQRAIQAAGSEWMRTRSDIQETIPAMQPHLEKLGYEAQAILTLQDPQEAAARTTRMMDQAYYAAKAEQLAKRREELEQKRFDQAAKLKKRKRAASVSSPSGKTAAPKRKQSVDPMTMPVDDLGELIDKIARQQQMG